MGTPFLGEIRIVSFNFNMKGWALCNGQLMPINQNAALFSILGTTYGGDGRTTFGLPNLQGRVPIHQGQGNGLSQVLLGEQRGSDTATLLATNLPPHSHSLMAAATGPTTNSPTGASLASQPRSAPPIYSSNAPNTDLAPAAIHVTGLSQPFSLLQPYLVLTFVIALQGIFPSRN